MGKGVQANRGGKFSTCPCPRHRFHKLKTCGHGEQRKIAPVPIFLLPGAVEGVLKMLDDRT